MEKSCPPYVLPDTYKAVLTNLLKCFSESLSLVIKDLLISNFSSQKCLTGKKLQFRRTYRNFFHQKILKFSLKVRKRSLKQRVFENFRRKPRDSYKAALTKLLRSFLLESKSFQKTIFLGKTIILPSFFPDTKTCLFHQLGESCLPNFQQWFAPCPRIFTKKHFFPDASLRLFF